MLILLKGNLIIIYTSYCIMIIIRSGIKGVLWKASRIGERLSPYIGTVYSYYITICTNNYF